ncbi:hypothetical protein [Haloarchaeobius sp. DFWS5]|uniref:hypothetical protein n=1 Tax=Haloarchaeobius sp. DFWS5 TaxID=3446114 RepID=UPI003EBCADB7
MAVVGLGIWLGGMGLFLAIGVRSTSGPLSVPAEAAIGVTTLWLFGVWFLAQRTRLHWRTVQNGDLLFTTVSTRTVAAGVVLTELCRAGLFLAARRFERYTPY